MHSSLRMLQGLQQGPSVRQQLHQPSVRVSQGPRMRLRRGRGVRVALRMADDAANLAQDLAETFSEVLNHLIPLVDAEKLDRGELPALRILLMRLATLFPEYEAERKAGRATGTLMDENGWKEFQELLQRLESELDSPGEQDWRSSKLHSQIRACLDAWRVPTP